MHAVPAFPHRFVFVLEFDRHLQAAGMIGRVLVGVGLVQVATMLLLLMRTKGLALLLGPDQVGIMGVVDKVVALLIQGASFSLPFAALRFLPGAWAHGPAPWRSLFRRMLRVLLVAVGAATVMAAVSALVRPAWWGRELAGFSPVLFAAALTIPGLALLPFLQSAVAGRLDQHRAMLVQLGQAGAGALAVVGATWAGLQGYYLTLAGLTVLGAATLGMRLVRGPVTFEPSGAPVGRLGLPVEIWRFSTLMLLLAILAPFAALFVHYQVLREHQSVTAGWMQASLGIALAVRMALGAAHSVFLTPQVNRGGAAPERMSWADRYQESFALLALPLASPLLLFPEWAVRLLYSSAFGPGAGFVAVFLLAEVTGLVSGVYQSLVVALDHLRFHLVQNLLAQGAVILVAAVAIGPWGIAGAGLAWLAGPLVLLVSTLVFLRIRHGLRVGHEARRRALVLLGGSGLAGLVGVATELESLSGVALRTATLVVLLAVVYRLRRPGEFERDPVRVGQAR